MKGTSPVVCDNEESRVESVERNLSVMREVWESVTHAVGTGIHDALNVAAAPLRAVQHGYRSLISLQDETNPGLAKGGYLNFSDPLSVLRTGYRITPMGMAGELENTVVHHL